MPQWRDWVTVVRFAFSPAQVVVGALGILVAAWTGWGQILGEKLQAPSWLEFGVLPWLGIITITFLVPGFYLLAGRLIEVSRSGNVPPVPEISPMHQLKATAVSMVLLIICIVGSALYRSHQGTDEFFGIVEPHVAGQQTMWTPIVGTCRVGEGLRTRAFCPANVALRLLFSNHHDYAVKLRYIYADMLVGETWSPLGRLSVGATLYEYLGIVNRAPVGAPILNGLNFERWIENGIPAHSDVDGYVLFVYPSWANMTSKPDEIRVTIVDTAGYRMVAYWHKQDVDYVNDAHNANAEPAWPITGGKIRLVPGGWFWPQYCSTRTSCTTISP